jgi:DNA polymerase III delta subunit
MITTLQRTQDPFMTFGLLSSQVFQLAALSVTDIPVNEVAKDIGAHPYALGKLVPHVQRLGRGGIKNIVEIFADTDRQMKSSTTDPWLLIEKTLMKTVNAARE